MPGKCPLCGQSLPHALNHGELQLRIQKLSSPALAAERRKLKEDYESRLQSAVEKSQQVAERQFQRQLREAKERAHADAQRDFKKQLLDAERRANSAETRRQVEVQQARKAAEVQSKKDLAQTIRLAAIQNESKLQKLQSERERDRIRHEADSAKLQGKLDELSRKLEKQSGEQLGSEAERDLLAELRNAFPEDKFEKIGRGVKGADILHSVMDGPKVAGRIVYESKNTLTWLNDFISQAKKYRTQYETPHVMVVTRAFPSKYKGLCVVRDIPVIEPRMAIALATVIREGIIEISKLRLSGNAHNEKSVELYQYIVGDKFCTRFRELAEGVDALRVQQQDERRWHERAWQTESKIHELIASRHREVDAQIRAICRGVSHADKQKMPARSESHIGIPYIATSSRG